MLDTYVTAARRGPTRRRRPGGGSVEALMMQIDALVIERQELRARGAGPSVLEGNRLRIVRAQWQLSLALIARHLPKPVRNAA